ncbi:MAG: FUSC family protein, partial [Enterobacterales bacterium]|nr:FUSC family protein [Enterobacterales bacterium]
TAAIIAFSTAESTDSMQIFDIAQARVCEVITGLLCGAFMMMILPSTSDGTNLLTSLRRMHQRLLEHAAMLWHPETTPEMRASHEGLIGQILTMNILRIQAFWSNHRLRSRNNVLNFLLHRQLRLTSVISSIRRMLVNWPDRPEVLQDVLRDIIKELQDPETNKYRLAKILSRIYPQDPSDYRLRTFYLRLRYFCWLYLQGSRWIRHVENSTPEDSFSPPKVHSIARHTDSMESAYNALRTFVVIIIGCAFWMSTQWDEGAGALTITAITCVLYSTSASPMTSLTTLFKAMVLLSIGCYLAKFGLMIQIDDFWVFCAFLLPVLLTMQLLKLQNPKTAALWGQLIVFMGSFLLVTNPPEYNYSSFVNDNIAKICGVLLAAVAFQILRPSSDKRKSRRIIRALRLDFMDQISRHPQQDESQFESRIYHRISQLNQSKDEVSRIWVLRWGVVLLNCSHIVWQLREWQTRSDPLSAVRDVCIHCLKGIMTEKGVQHESLDGTLAELLRISDVLSRHPDQSGRDLAGLVWRLYCSLSQLQQSVVPTVANKA